MREAYVKTYEALRRYLWGAPKWEKQAYEFSTWKEDTEHLAIKTSFRGLQQAHVFEVDKRLGQVLVHTPNRLRDNIQLPFDYTYVDIILTVENKKYFGFLLIDIDALYEQGHDIISTAPAPLEKRQIVLVCCGVEDNKLFCIQYTLHRELTDESLVRGRVTRRHRRERTMLITAAMNFLDFLNEPEVIVKRVKYDEKLSAKRVKLGKVPIPKIRDRVRVTGKLKKYLNSIHHGAHSPYTHRFWVRGHWRTLRNERYGDNVGSRVWIHPYVKGDGLLVDKTYDAIKEE